MSPTQFELAMMGAKIAVVIGGLLAALPLILWLERRACAWMQGRIGPNRVGPFGLLQPLADVVKFVFKENFTPDHVNKFYYFLAPAICCIAPVAAFCTIPFGSHVIIDGKQVTMQIANLNAGFLFILAFAGLEVYPIIIAGWASKNKYSVLGALRGSSQIVSYEIAMGFALVSHVVLYGSVELQKIVEMQSGTLFGILPAWGVFLNPVAALIVWISIFAETNRLPFDLPEGEAELVAGYHVEYASVKFALFFTAEYIAMTMASALLATFFFGGYNLLPGMDLIASAVSNHYSFGPVGQQNVIAALQAVSLAIKTAFFLFVYIWIRWTLPRFRFDQLMDLGWKILFPLSMINVLVISAFVFFQARA